jgi:hypothetical protein
MRGQKQTEGSLMKRKAKDPDNYSKVVRTDVKNPFLIRKLEELNPDRNPISSDDITNLIISLETEEFNIFLYN